jgi:lambda family phage minor tail protein L
MTINVLNTYDLADGAGGATGEATSFTFSITIAAAADYIWLARHSGRFSTNRNPTGITVDGDAMTLIASSRVTGQSSFDTDAWELKAPSTGTVDVVISFADNVRGVVLKGAALENVDQTTPLEGFDTSTSGSSPFDLAPTTTTVAGGLIIGLIHGRDPSLTGVSDTEFGISVNNCVYNSDGGVLGAGYVATTGSGEALTFTTRFSGCNARVWAVKEAVSGGVVGLLGTANAIGYVANVNIHKNIDTSQAIGVASGYLASIQQGGGIQGTLGTASAIGYLANISINVEITASAATASATGFIATVSNGLVIESIPATANAIGFLASVQFDKSIEALIGVANAIGYLSVMSFSTQEYGVSEQIQSLTPDALVEFFIIDLLPIGVNEQYYFHNGINGLGTDITWQGQIYTRFPIEAEGFEWKGTGTQPRPTLRVGNITGLLSALANENNDLVGVKVKRLRTFSKYIDAVNFSGGNLSADPNIHAPDETWFVDRKSNENWIFVEWELRGGGDLTGVKLPKRQCIQNVCLWKYRSAECSYIGGAVADVVDVLTNDLAFDVCGKRLSSCKLRFPEPAQLPFGGFPALGLLR